MNIHDWLALTRLMSIDSEDTFSRMLSAVERRYSESSQTNSPLLMIAQALKVECTDTPVFYFAV
jgi:regulator of sirC expression with transglutaminase-like and TPR domain